MTGTIRGSFVWYWHTLPQLLQRSWPNTMATFKLFCSSFCVSFNHSNRESLTQQTIYWHFLVVIVYFSEDINEIAARNWQSFSKQQYFDSNGFFISTVFSIPILLNCMLMIVSVWNKGTSWIAKRVDFYSVCMYREIGCTVQRNWWQKSRQNNWGQCTGGSEINVQKLIKYLQIKRARTHISTVQNLNYHPIALYVPPTAYEIYTHNTWTVFVHRPYN